MSIIHSIVYLL